MKKFITFEGGEGAGKTTLLNNLKNYLDEKQIEYIAVREPGGTQECEKIREFVLTSKDISPVSQFLLFSASRSILVDKVISPALNQNKLVLCDRYFDSSRVYQGFCSNINDEDILYITNFATSGLIPEITFYLDIDPIVAFKRKQKIDENDVFETKNLEFHNKVREGFLRLARKESNRFVVLDATKSQQEILDNVVDILKKRGVI